MKTSEQLVQQLWEEYQDDGGGGDNADQQAFRRVVMPLVACLNKIAGGGMFSETACIVAAREVLKVE